MSKQNSSVELLSRLLVLLLFVNRSVADEPKGNIDGKEPAPTSSGVVAKSTTAVQDSAVDPEQFWPQLLNLRNIDEPTLTPSDPRCLLANRVYRRYIKDTGWVYDLSGPNREFRENPAVSLYKGSTVPGSWVGSTNNFWFEFKGVNAAPQWKKIVNPWLEGVVLLHENDPDAHEVNTIFLLSIAEPRRLGFDMHSSGKRDKYEIAEKSEEEMDFDKRNKSASGSNPNVPPPKK